MKMDGMRARIGIWWALWKLRHSLGTVSKKERWLLLRHFSLTGRVVQAIPEMIPGSDADGSSNGPEKVAEALLIDALERSEIPKE